MNLRHCLTARGRKLVVLFVLCVATVSLATTAAAPCRADDTAAKQPKALPASLHLIPADAACYGSMLRNREQVEAVLHSRAWAKLQQMPVVQMARVMAQMKMASPDGKTAELKKYLESPLARRGLGLLADMFSNEVFFYADADAVDSLQLMQEIGAVMNYGPPLLQLSGEAKDLDENEIQMMLLLAALAENADRLKVPGMVFGFKVEDKIRAAEHIGKLEVVLTALLSRRPGGIKALQHTDVGGHDYLVLTLEGRMIPWDQIPIELVKRWELREGDLDTLVERLKKEKLVVAVGLRDDYLMVSVGSSTAPLAKLGTGPSLAGRPEIAPLAQFADRKLTAIHYASKDFMAAANGNQRQIHDVLDFVEQLLPLLELTDEQRAKILADAKELGETLEAKMPVAGAASQVTFLSDRGVESFRYNWSTYPGLDASRNLGILTHVGGSPLLAVAARGKASIDDYDLTVKWLAKGYGYFRDYALPNLPEEKRQQFDKLVETAEPILAHIHQTTREKFLPALDGQFALVVDGKLTSKQFLATLPATDQALPMAEPALLLGVRDAELMRGALVDYWNSIHEIWNAAGEFRPELADAALPEPKTVDTDGGEMFVFTPPAECPVDKQITPTVALGKDVCVFAMSQSHAERLLKPTPLAAGGVLADTDHPMAMAVVLDWSGMLQAARPWAEMLVEKAIQKEYGPDAPPAQTQAIKMQVFMVMDLLSVVRRVTSEAHVDKDAMVTHTITEIRDVD